MRSTTIFSSPNVNEVYAAYNELSAVFLKQFKFQAEFGISHKTTEKNFSLNVYDVDEVELEFLLLGVSEILQKKTKKLVD